MPWQNVYDGDGKIIGTRITCDRGGNRSGGPCVGCKRRNNQLFLCDFPVLRDGVKTTCDARICFECKTKVGPDRDLCPPHAKLWDFTTGKPTVGPLAAPPLKPVPERPLAPAPEKRPRQPTRGPGGSTVSCLAPLNDVPPDLDDETDELAKLEFPEEP